MKLWVSARHLPSHTNPNRPSTGYALHRRHIPCLLLSSQHMPKCPIRLTHPQPPRQWRLILLHLHLPAYRARLLLRLLSVQRNLKYRSNPPAHSHSNRFCGLCPAMRTNIILRSHRNYQPVFSPPVHRTNPGRMGLRRVLSGQPNPDPILRHSLPPALFNRRDHPSSLNLPARIRLKQPPRHCIRL